MMTIKKTLSCHGLTFEKYLDVRNIDTSIYAYSKLAEDQL